MQALGRWNQGQKFQSSRLSLATESHLTHIRRGVGTIRWEQDPQRLQSVTVHNGDPNTPGQGETVQEAPGLLRLPSETIPKRKMY